MTDIIVIVAVVVFIMFSLVVEMQLRRIAHIHSSILEELEQARLDRRQG